MVSLIAKTPTGGMDPLEIGAARLSEIRPEAITSIAPFDGQEKAAQGKRAGESGGADSKEESGGREGER